MSIMYDLKVHLIKNCGDNVLQDKQAQIIGYLIFLTNYSGPDIAYDVGRLSKYIYSSRVEHWDTISIFLIYSKGTFYFCLSYCGYPVVLEGYCDAN